jgi:hypothetical protein
LATPERPTSTNLQINLNIGESTNVNGVPIEERIKALRDALKPKTALVEKNQPVSIGHWFFKTGIHWIPVWQKQYLLDTVRRIKDCFQKKKRSLWIKNPRNPENNRKGAPTAHSFELGASPPNPRQIGKPSPHQK